MMDENKSRSGVTENQGGLGKCETGNQNTTLDYKE
jgi:hypothetical protein